MDISTWQGKISVDNFKKAMNAGIKFAILRVGFTGSESKKPALDNVFENNYANAIAAGLPIGIYYYSLATTVAKAQEEAQWVVEKIKGLNVTYPVYIDIEDPTYQGKCSKSTLANVCNAFCDIITNAGYTAGVYASVSWLNDKIGTITSKHETWVAQYYKECQYKGDYSMWQYSSSESVPGIDDKTDVNWCYKEFTPSPQPEPEPTPSGDKYTGEMPTLTIQKSNAEVIQGAITWAKWIASDNDFHYGYTSKDKKINAHHNGCYFCGTNTTSGGRSKKGIVMYEHSYCCNPFVHAAWAHGGCIPQALTICKKGSSWDFQKGTGYDKSTLFDNLGHPAKSQLKPGDVLCRDTHVALYVGNGKIAEASGGDDNVIHSAKWNKSISIKTLTDANYKKFPRVHRYNGVVDTTLNITHGEISDRVKLWQAFLNWFNNKEVVTADGIFGDGTLAQTKFFQDAVGITADGIIGATTLKVASEYCKPAPTPTKKKYQGEFPNITVLWKTANQQVKEGIIAWCKKIVADGSYHYVKWTSDELTHKCAVCHPEKYAKKKAYKGWQCIGFATAALKHGGTIPVTCNCSGTINDGYGDKMLQNPNKALQLWKAYKNNGSDWTMIYNNGKKIPESMLQSGDYLVHSAPDNFKKFKHATIKGDAGYLYHASGGTKPIARAKFPLSSRPCIMAFRYTGKGSFKDLYRQYLQINDTGTEVKKLQDFLLWAGYNLGEYGADGQFGVATENAVKAFQTDNKLTVDGKFGTDCLAKAKEIER